MKYLLLFLSLLVTASAQPTLANSDDIIAAKARANHTGTQASSTISDLASVTTAAISAAITGPTRIPEHGPPVPYVPAADTDTARFAAWTLAHTALQTGETLVTPPGDYYVTTNFINLKSATYIFNGSRFYIDASTAAGGAGSYANWTFWGSGLSNITIRGPWIIDANGVSGKVGMVFANSVGANISEIWFKGFSGGTGTLTGCGLYVSGGSPFTPSKSATNLRATGCNTGIYTEAGAEYWTFTACHTDSNTTGIYNSGGNNQFMGCHVTLNSVGVLLSGSGNAGHGSFVGGCINHNTSRGIKMKTGFPLGFVFSGVQMFANGTSAYDLGGAGAQFNGCEITGGIVCTEAQEGIHIFRGCLFADSASTPINTLTAPQRANIKFLDCKTLTGEWAYNDPIPAPVYTVTNLPAAAASTYGSCAVTDSLAPTIGVAVSAGGSAKCIVTSNGTNWIVTSTL